MRVREHGTRACYVFGPTGQDYRNGCRCFPCRVVTTRYEAARQAKRRQPHRVRYVAPTREWLVREFDGSRDGRIVHRTSDREEAYAIRDALNARRRKPDPIWAGRKLEMDVRRHLDYLRVAGVGLHQVARVTGVSRSRLQEIDQGRGKRRGRPLKRRLKRSTAERILGVGASEAADAAVVPASETWKLLDRLLELGYTKTDLARRLGSTAKTPALQLRRDRVLAGSARKVRELYRELWREDPRVRALDGHGDDSSAVARRRRRRELAEAVA